MVQGTSRDLGLDVVRDAPWGSHLAALYTTPEELALVTGAYLAEGLSSNQRCIWVTSDPLVYATARRTLRTLIPGLADFLRSGQLEVVPNVQDPRFQKLPVEWEGRRMQAVAGGFDGLRVACDASGREGVTSWACGLYEQDDPHLSGKTISALCTYHVERCGLKGAIDIMRTHDITLVRGEEQWEALAHALRAGTSISDDAELYGRLVEMSGAWITRLDRMGVPTLAIGGEKYGLAEGKLLEHLVPEDRDYFRMLLSRVLDTAESSKGVMLRAEAHGMRRQLLTVWEPISDAHGHVSEIQITALDVTEQKRLEEHYQQAQRVENLGRLAGGIAHDFNNVLAVIDGYATVAMQHLPASNPARDLIDEMKEAVHRGASLTKQLLAFARGRPPQPTVLDLSKLLTNLETLLQRMIGDHLSLSIKAPAGLWPVRADPGQMEQVLVNLGVNARDAMPDGGRVCIELANVHVDGPLEAAQEEIRPGDYVRLTVSDTGAGMSDEVKAQMFEPFFTTKPHGTGLGLATCRAIIEQSGGHISVSSRVGRGTSVMVYLPRLPEGTLG